MKLCCVDCFFVCFSYLWVSVWSLRLWIILKFMLDVRHLPTKTQIVFSRSNLTGLSPLKLSTSENRCNSNLIYSSIPSSSWSLRVWVSPTRARHRGGAPTTRNHLHSLFQSSFPAWLWCQSKGGWIFRFPIIIGETESTRFTQPSTEQYCKCWKGRL